MHIERLTETEEELLARMPQGGFFEMRHRYLVENGIYDEWRELFEKYVGLALDGDLEALKRALFLAWFEACEPAPLSGLFDLNEQVVVTLLEYLDSKVKRDETDSELKWMLPYYYCIADWYTPKSASVDALVKFSRQGDEKSFMEHLNQKQMVERGLLGSYWCSIRL